MSWLRVSAFVVLQGYEKDQGFSTRLLVAEKAKLGTIEPTTRKTFVDAQVLAAGHATGFSLWLKVQTDDRGRLWFHFPNYISSDVVN